MTNNKKISINYIYNLFAVVFEMVIPLITTPYLSRILEPDGIGIYSYTYSLILIFVLMGALGTATHGQRIIAMKKDDKNLYSKAFWEILIIRTFSLSIFMIFYLFISFFSGYVIYFLIQIPYFFSAMLDITWFYQGLEDFKVITFKRIFIKLFGIFFIFIFVKNKEDLLLYLLILTLVQLLGNLSLWLNIKKYISKIPFKDLKVSDHYQDILIYFIPTIAYQLYSLIDKVFLGIFSSETETGFYEQAQKLVNTLISIIIAYNTVIKSRMANLYFNKDNNNIKSLLNNSINFVMLITMPIAFGLAAIAKNFVPCFFGEDYTKVEFLIYVFFPVIIFMSIKSSLNSMIFTPFGMQKKANVGECLAAIVNCVVSIVLIPIYGALGAVISTLISEFIIVIMLFVYCSKFLSICTFIKVTYKKIIAAILMFIFIFPISFYYDSWLCILMQICLGAFIYFITLVILKDQYMLMIISKIKRRENGKI